MSSERQADHPDNPWWGEHVHRYLEAMKILGPCKVLDIACGTGFGSMMLAENGYDVKGADISEETILQCQTRYQHPHLEFLRADASRLSFSDGEFDAVISFETIEHSRQYLAMLREFYRVTKKDGMVLISTPNFIVNSPSGKVENPYHTQEWRRAELMTLLKSVFASVELFGQKYIRYEQRTFRTSLAHFIETMFYMRGVRKLPLKFQDSVMNALSKKPMYPLPEDYVMVSDTAEIEKCKTFFAICKK